MIQVPEVPDRGCCYPLPLIKSCEAPVVPTPSCDDDEFTLEQSPGGKIQFRIVSRVFDENCLPIEDEDGNPIITVKV